LFSSGRVLGLSRLTLWLDGDERTLTLPNLIYITLLISWHKLD